MKRKLSQMISLLASERGATATEYSILAGFIAMIIVAGVGVFGLALDGYFGELANGVKAALGLP
ncbi:Flp family type IVb pilin [Arthrobacter cavernae]|uniref:Flp family type IVb pilin n=1 Tax=Arthrobacter cavernae TaxID=2817681 RepID=A0A939KN23_9MICC|nr:Flp family type IVb pilin [Arthrobacter cavernae]MBO1267210.1 Flp family type IVb pilin [Arthrobacter cavernae]